MNEAAIERLEGLLEAMKPDPKMDGFVWVGKNISKKDLCMSLQQVLEELKGGC